MSSSTSDVILIGSVSRTTVPSVSFRTVRTRSDPRCRPGHPGSRRFRLRTLSTRPWKFVTTLKPQWTRREDTEDTEKCSFHHLCALWASARCSLWFLPWSPICGDLYSELLSWPSALGPLGRVREAYAQARCLRSQAQIGADQSDAPSPGSEPSELLSRPSALGPLGRVREAYAQARCLRSQAQIIRLRTLRAAVAAVRFGPGA